MTVTLTRASLFFMFLHNAQHDLHRRGQATKFVFPTLMHLDVGEVDHASCVHVPAVGLQSHVPSDDLSDCTRHAAAVSSHGSVTGKNNCISKVLVPMTFCGLLPRLVESQFRGESDKRPDYSNSDPSSRRQALVESESLPEIYDPVPDAEGGTWSEECNDVQESRGAGTRNCASSRAAR